MDSPAVIARGITVRGEEGPVYGPLHFEIPTTGLTVLAGRSGSGRTALALTIAGRMKPSAGELTVLGETKPSKIRPKVALAGVASIDQLDRNVRLSVVFSEHRAWSTPWLMWARRADQQYYEEICQPIFGVHELPPLHAYVGEITALDRLLIRIALAVNPARGSKIEMLVMDDLEQVREDEDRALLLDTLAKLSDAMPVAVNSVNPLPNFPSIELITDDAYIHHPKEHQ